MKRLYITLLIAIIAMVSQDVIAKRAKTSRSTIPFEKLVTMIATEAHWSEINLAKLGLNKLGKRTHREEFGECIIFIYGKNAKATISKNWNVTLKSTGPHAFAIEFAGTTDNGTVLYFKEKADYDAFMAYARKSKYYKRYEDGFESVGYSNIEGYEYHNGWHVIYFHGG